MYSLGSDGNVVLVNVDAIRRATEATFRICGLTVRKSYSPSFYYNFITPHILNRFVLLVNSYFLLQARSAEVCADVLISNDLRGNDSHGVSNMLRKVIIESNQRNFLFHVHISNIFFTYFLNGLICQKHLWFFFIKFVWNWNLIIAWIENWLLNTVNYSADRHNYLESWKDVCLFSVYWMVSTWKTKSQALC